MSVPEYRRGVSDMQFLYKARELHLHTLKKTKSWPKTYTLKLAVPMCNMAFKIHSYLIAGNSVYPTNAEEVQMRRDYFLQARSLLYSLSAMIEVAREAIGFDMDGKKFWIDIVADEIKLINGLLKSDKKRFQNMV